MKKLVEVDLKIQRITSVSKTPPFCSYPYRKFKMRRSWRNPIGLGYKLQ
jgi:hypothetical protein